MDIVIIIDFVNVPLELIDFVSVLMAGLYKTDKRGTIDDVFITAVFLEIFGQLSSFLLHGKNCR